MNRAIGVRHSVSLSIEVALGNDPRSYIKTTAGTLCSSVQLRPSRINTTLNMAPPTRARSLSCSHFTPAFSKLKTSVYQDNPRPGSVVPSHHFIRTLSWNASGTFIATGSADRTLRIWNPEKTNVKNSTELRTPGATAPTALERVAFHPINENELASCGTDGMVRFWDIRTKASVGEVKVGEQPFTLAWTPDGSEIVAGRKVGHTVKPTLNMP